MWRPPISDHPDDGPVAPGRNRLRAVGDSQRREKMKLIFGTKYNAEALAVFCKRITFEDAYRRADGKTEEERKAMAYRILTALSDVETCLEEAGFSSR
jgi:hypothetical protein